MAFLYKADPQRGQEWARLFAEQAPHIPFRLWPDVGDPREIRYLAAWEPPLNLAEAYPSLEIIFSVGAGVDQFDLTSIPEKIPVVRMIEPGIVTGMVEFVTIATLAVHRDLVAYVAQQRQQRWEPIRVRSAPSRRVGVMGLGVLGQAVLASLAAFGFQLAGWSRSRHAIAGVDCYAGPGELADFLRGCDVLVCLLPLTPETQGVLSRRLFRTLPAGAVVINVGRGGHLVESDLIAALDDGHLSAAILDVSEIEPLPEDHPFWRHPRILLTPHVASMTQPETAVDVILDNIRRHEHGHLLKGLIDRARGY